MTNETTGAQDIDAIVAEISVQTALPGPDATRDEKIAADVDAILKEIAGSTGAELTVVTVTPVNSDQAPAEKPKRARRTKEQNAPTTPPVDAAAGAGDTTPAAPSPAPAATNNGAFSALLLDGDRAEFASRLDAAAKKVKEKIENAVARIERGKKLSRFTELAVRKLVTAGEVTSGDLVEAYKADGLAIGTARAQGQQMTALFRALGLADKDGGTYRLANKELGEKLLAA